MSGRKQNARESRRPAHAIQCSGVAYSRDSSSFPQGMLISVAGVRSGLARLQRAAFSRSIATSNGPQHSKARFSSTTKKWISMGVAGSSLALFGWSAKDELLPYAKKFPKILQDGRVDNYYWLRDDERTNPKVLAQLQRENEHTERSMADTKDVQQTLFEEFKSRTKEEDVSVPVRKDNYLYYRRMAKGKQYPIYCRQPLTVVTKDTCTAARILEHIELEEV